MNAELSEELRINGGSRVLVVRFFSEDGQWWCHGRRTERSIAIVRSR